MNIFLFFYLFILFVLLTPGTIITVSMWKQFSGSKPMSIWMVAAIHGFLFSVIAITTYSFVNDLYISLMSPIKDPFINVDTGYTFTSSDGDKPFNTLSDTPPAKVQAPSGSGPNIKCGHYKFCGSADPASKRVYCYGNKDGCLWGQQDCGTDTDCKKYNENSVKYTDAIYSNSYICPNYPDGSWPSEFCKFQKLPIKP